MSETLSRTLARFVAELRHDALPPEVLDKLKASLLHALVVSIIGADTSHGKAAIALTRAEEARPDGATLLVDGSRATRCGAAFANSKLMHATNQSDSYRMLTHPGPCVIPAVLAGAELGDKGGAALLTAMAAGYEVEARIAGDFIPSTQARGFRSSAVYGTLGAAMAAGKLLDLREDQLVTALALACTFTGGTTEGPRVGGQEMLFHEPNATRNGILAALLAREPVRGSETALEGAAGFYHAFVGNNRGDLTFVFNGPLHTSLDTVVADLGSRWELLRVTPKIYPTAGYNCPVIDLMTRLRAQHELPAADVAHIRVEMNWLETLYPSPAFPSPTRSAPGVGSTHFFVAYTCVHGHYPPLLLPREAAASAGEAVSALMDRVQVVGQHGRLSFAPRITVQMRDGRTVQDEFQGDELQWDLETEIRRLTPLFDALPWPRDRLEALVQAVSRLDEAPRIEPLVRLCVRD